MKVLIIVCISLGMIFGQAIFEEYFTDGNMQLQWHAWFTDSLGIGDSMMVISDPSTPGGDSWAGKISNEYMGMAGLTYSGNQNLMDYSIESYIYTVVSTSAGGPYNGVAIRMDSASRYYYRLVSDFDTDARLRLGLVAGGGFPVVLRDWISTDIPGGVPATSSWHKLKLEAMGDSLWAYYDDVMLPGCPIINDSVAQGYFGIYVFSFADTASTKCDNIYVFDVTGVNEYDNQVIGSICAYPNPFRSDINIQLNKQKNTVSPMFKVLHIYDAAGRLVRQLPLTSSTYVSWNGKNCAGNIVSPGVYFITDGHANTLTKVVKLR